MRILSVILWTSYLFTSFAYAQTPATKDSNNTLRKAVLLSDVKTLALEIPKLDTPLARAMAQAEIADAAWTLDRKWAMGLLKQAYQLTYLTEEEKRKLGPEPPGTPPRPPTALSRARNEVRKRILSVARRDRTFADQLIIDSSENVSKDDRQMMHAQLTMMALNEGDTPAAVHSIQKNIAIDPTQLMLVQLINLLALKDRAAADKLILEHIVSLTSTQLEEGWFGGRVRGETILGWLVFPNSFFPDPNNQVPGPGPEVMRAYVRYVIETLSALEQTKPGSLPRHRSLLLSTWLPLNQHAPEFKESFMQLEGLSRTPGQDASLPTKSNEELDQDLFRKRQTEALTSNEPNARSIDAFILREDFEIARKLISKLPDGEEKKQFTEKLNTREAISLVRKGDLFEARALAERLTTTGALLQVYPLILQGYGAKKDQVAVSVTVHQAVRQLQQINSKPASPAKQFGMSAEFAPAATENDGMLSALGKLASAVLPVDALLGAEIVDDVVTRSNSSQIDTTQGRTGIDSDLFKSFASKDEVRAHSAAQSFKDRLRRTVALAAIYQWRAKELEKAARN